MTPAISIVMPCYNGRAHLPRSIASVQAQTCGDWELVVIDDGSRDGSADWVESLGDARIRCIRQANSGVSAARNAGLRAARGARICFLDADDCWEATLLEKLSAALDAQPDAVLAYCGWQNVGLGGGRDLPFVPPDYETPDKAQRLFAGCRWPIHAVMVRADAIQAAGGFDTGLRNAEDYLLWLKIAIPGRIVRVPEVLAKYFFHGQGQASQNKARAALDFLRAQTAHLAADPALRRTLGPAARTLMYDALLQRGYECYWARELADARRIFRAVMRAGYGRPADWRHMPPALLPQGLFVRLVESIDRVRGPSSPQR